MRKRVYDMDWGLSEEDFDSRVFVAAPFGGPIAVFQDTNRVTDYVGGNRLEIYSPCGNLIGSGEMPDHFKLAPGGAFWTGSEELILVSKLGAVFMYNMHGVGPSVFEILPPASDDRVMLCSPVQRSFCNVERPDGISDSGSFVSFDDDERFQTGLILLCESGRVLFVEDMAAASLDDIYMLGRHSIFIDPRGASKRTITCMAVLNVLNPTDGRVRVLFGTSDRSILHVCGKDITDLNLREVLPAKVMKMAVIPGGGLVACWCMDGNLIVLKENLKERMNMKIDTGSATVPRQMVWVGEHGVLLEWKNFGLLMIGPKGESVKFEESSDSTVLVQELDSCRMVKPEQHELLKKYSNRLSKTFETGGTGPSALLFDIWQSDANNETRVDDSIRALIDDGKLVQAVKDLLAVAVAEFPDHHPFTASDVLQAASYGYGFCLDELKYESEKVQHIAWNLRLLKTLSLPEVGIPMTVEQYHMCGNDLVVDRLTKRHLHGLALRVCKEQGVSSSPVLVHWACAKVERTKSHISDDELCTLLETKLCSEKNISYRKIARVAANVNRPVLAAKLLEFEPLASNRTNMLLELQQNGKALASAVHSRDTNLVYKTLFAIKSRLIPQDESSGAQNDCEESFLKLLIAVPDACILLESHLHKYSTEIKRKALDPFLKSADSKILSGRPDTESSMFDGFLAKLYDYTEEHTKAANLMAKLAYNSPSLSKRLDRMNFCQEMYAVSARSSSNGKDGQLTAKFSAAVSSEHRNLLALQADLEKKFGTGTFVDFSVTDTMRKLLKLGIPEYSHMADTMRIDFKVSDRRFWYIKLLALSDRGEWVALRRFAKERKSPIGYVPFANTCMLKGEMGEAAHYVRMVKDEYKQLDLWEKLKNWENAMNLAYKLGDGARLYHIYEECGSFQVQSQCQELALKMGFGKFG
eukprot:g2931.t1